MEEQEPKIQEEIIIESLEIKEVGAVITIRNLLGHLLIADMNFLKENFRMAKGLLDELACKRKTNASVLKIEGMIGALDYLTAIGYYGCGHIENSSLGQDINTDELAEKIFMNRNKKTGVDE